MAGLDDLSDDELLALHAQAAPDADRDYLVRTVYGEARGEPPEGQKAVASVILNRARQTGKPVRDIVLAPAQFTPWHDAKAREQLTSLSEDSPEYRTISDNIASALDGEDNTGGADHFYAPKLADPTWAHGQQGTDIGNHRFLKLGYGSNAQAGGSGDDDLAHMSDEQLMAAYKATQAAEAPEATTPPPVAAPAVAAPRKAPAVPLKVDQTLGFQKGAVKPWDNAAIGLEWLVDKATGSNQPGRFSHMFGQPSAREAADSHAAYVEDQRRKGIIPGKKGEFVGSVVGTAPLALLPGGAAVQGAAGGLALSDAKDAKGLALDTVTGAASGKVADLGVRGLGKLASSALAKVPKIMSVPQLKVAVDQAYDKVRAAGIVIPKADAQALSGDVAALIRAKGGPKAAKLYGDADALAARLQALSSQKGGVPISQLEELRSDIYTTLVKPGGKEATIGVAMRQKIDGLMDTVAAGNPLLREARALNARWKKADYVTRMSKSADRAAERTYGGDYGRKIKDRLNPLVDEAMPNRNLRGGTAEELQAIDRIVRGTKLQNFASTAGGMLDPRRLGGKILAGVTGPGGAMGAGPTGGLSLAIPAAQMAAGFGLTGIASSTARRNVEDLLKLIAAGGSRQALKRVPTVASRVAERTVARARPAAGLTGAAVAAQFGGL